MMTTLTFTTLCANSADDNDIFLFFFFFFFFFFLSETGFDISCKMSPLQLICMKCHILFSRENKKTFQYAVC